MEQERTVSLEIKDQPPGGANWGRLLSKEELAKLAIPQKSLILVGFIYLIGYLITQIFARSLGIETLSFAKAQYIESGLVFTVVTFTLIFLPYGMLGLQKKMRAVHGLPRQGVEKTILLFPQLLLGSAVFRLVYHEL